MTEHNLPPGTGTPDSPPPSSGRTQLHRNGAGGNGGNDSTRAGGESGDHHGHETAAGSRFPWGTLLLGLLGLVVLIAIISHFLPDDTGNKVPPIVATAPMPAPKPAPTLATPPVPTPPSAPEVAVASPAPAPVINNYYYPQPAPPAPRHHRGARNAAGSVASAASQDPWAAELVQTSGTHADDLNRIRAEAQAKAHARFEGAANPQEAPNP